MRDSIDNESGHTEPEETCELCNPKPRIILRYKKGSKEINSWMSDPQERRMWDVLTPLEGYAPGTIQTFSLKGLIRKGLVPGASV